MAMAGKNQLKVPGRAAGRERRGRAGAPPDIGGALRGGEGMADGARCGVLPGQALVAIAGKNHLKNRRRG